MKRVLAAVVFSCFSVVALAQEGGSRDTSMDEIQLRAKVQALVPLNDFSGKVLPVHVDPRFALTVRIVSVRPSVTEFNPPAVVTFGIHSPATVFAGDFTSGKTYNFSLCRETLEPPLYGRARYSAFGIRLANGERSGGCRIDATATDLSKSPLLICGGFTGPSALDSREGTFMKWDYVLIGMFLLLTIGLGLIFVILNRKQVSLSALAGNGSPS